MISKEQAEQIVTQYLDEGHRHITGGVSLVEEETIEKPYGWIFCYNSNEYLQTHDWHKALTGNSPFVVERADGTITPLGTAGALEESIFEFEKERGFLR